MPSALEQLIPIVGIPLWQALLLGAFAFIIYLIVTRKPKLKEFKPLDLKKETKSRFKKEYKFFGMPIGKNIYNPVPAGEINEPKPVAFVIGMMKKVEQKAMKRSEPIYAKVPPEQLAIMHQQMAQDIYQKNYLDLDEKEKKSVHEAALEEIRNQRVEEMSQSEKFKVIRGRKVTEYTTPVPTLLLKICAPDMMSKFLARFANHGVEWLALNASQVNFKEDGLYLTADFQRRLYNNIFILSKEGKDMTQDVGFNIEREEFMGAVANSIQRVLFNNDQARDINLRREDARIENEKHKAQKESHDFN